MSVSTITMQYPTSWAGVMSFEAIYVDLAAYVKPNGIQPHQLEEYQQIGMKVLWEQLAVQPDFLTEKTRRQTMFFIAVKVHRQRLWLPPIVIRLASVPLSRCRSMV